MHLSFMITRLIQPFSVQIHDTRNSEIVMSLQHQIVLTHIVG